MDDEYVGRKMYRSSLGQSVSVDPENVLPLVDYARWSTWRCVRVPNTSDSFIPNRLQKRSHHRQIRVQSATTFFSCDL